MNTRVLYMTGNVTSTSFFWAEILWSLLKAPKPSVSFTTYWLKLTYLQPREIRLSSGWIIKIGRGLDIFRWTYLSLTFYNDRMKYSNTSILLNYPFNLISLDKHVSKILLLFYLNYIDCPYISWIYRIIIYSDIPK